jgi:lambda family phage portal protein
MNSREETKISVIDRAANAIDRTIGFFNPKAGYRRQAFRQSGRMLASSYRGADRGRLRTDWFPQGYSADRDLQYDHELLRQRSRDLNRNDAFASGITNTIVINDIGIGIKPQSRINAVELGISEDKAVEYQDLAEAIWDEWVKIADASERMDFYDMQSLIDRQILENGESLLLPLMIPDKNRPFKLALMSIESDRLSTPPKLSGDKNIRFGVRVGERNEPLVYYVRKTHPGDIYANRISGDDYIEYPAKDKFGRPNIFHLYEVKRSGQTRGIPFFAPVLTYFKDLGDYTEAELVAARIAACFAMFIKKTDPTGSLNVRTTQQPGSSKRLEAFEPAQVEYLNEGESIDFVNPTRPNAQMEPFINHVLKAICASLNLSYEIVSKDFSKSTYSSARAGLLQAYRFFRMRQNWHSRRYCQPCYEMVLEEAFLRGKFPVKDFYEKKAAYVKSFWIAPGWQWVDPLKEAEASELAINMGLSTLADEAAAQGKDIDEILGQRARELVKIKTLEEKNGIKIIKDKQVKPNNQNNGGNQNGAQVD